MRIAIFGSGGVGGYFGARLAAAGHDVHFIARGAHLAAMRSRGLRVESTLGNVHVPQPQAHADPAEIGAVDFVLFAVKLADVASAAERLRPLLAERTRVLCFQNGVEAPEIVGRVIGAKHVLPGVAYIATAIAEPGVVRHTGTMQRLQVGAGAERFVEACKGAGINIEQVDDIERARWEKFVFLEALSGVTTLARAPVGVCRADAELRASFEAAMDEAWRVGRKLRFNQATQLRPPLRLRAGFDGPGSVQVVQAAAGRGDHRARHGWVKGLATGTIAERATNA